MSVIVPPLSKFRSPSIVDVPMIKFVVPPSISTSPSVSKPVSLVVISKAPVNAFVIESTIKSIVALSALVTSVLVPLIVRAPVWVMFPVVAVALRSPSTVEAASCTAVALTIVAWLVLLLPSTCSNDK